MKICFTGKRPKDLCGYESYMYTEFKLALFKLLEDLFISSVAPLRIQSKGSVRFHVLNTLSTINTNTDEILFLTGGAQGFDQLAFTSTCLLSQKYSHVKTCICVPFKGQELAWREEGIFGQKQYNDMIKRADDVVYLNDVLTERSNVVTALMERNHYMVDNSNIVVALYPDDTWVNSKGGTAECMRYARKKGKPIVQIKYTVDNGLSIKSVSII